MPADQVVIVGGGIGGLGAALMLARRGIPVRVLERADEFREVGAGLQLAPNITRMLDEVGILDKILPHAVEPRRLRFMNAKTGEELTHIDLADARERYGGRYLVLHRSDLLDAMLVAVRAEPGVTLHTGHSVTTIDDSGPSVVVSCENGARFTTKLLVGADGAQSVVRAHVADDEPVASGYVAYRGTVPAESFGSAMDMEAVTVWMGPGLHFVQYPVRGGKLCNQVAVFRSKQFLEGEEDWGTADELDATYDSMADGVRSGVPYLQRANRWAMEDREPLETWSRGRITLLGDAAHVMLQYLAQGAGQSLLDGAELARNLEPLAEIGWDDQAVADALRAYEGARVVEAGRVQTIARTWGDIWHVAEGVPMLLRDEVFRSRDIYDYSFVDWLYGPVRGEMEAPPPPGIPRSDSTSATSGRKVK